MNSNHSKIIVAPQISIYKNIFGQNKEIIDLLNSNSNKYFFKDWSEWYDQGFRTSAYIDKKDKVFSDNLYEFSIISNLIKSFEYVIYDYFKDFEKDKGVWPSFIINWDKIEKYKNQYEIDFFKYEYEKVKYKYKDSENNLFLQYHVDEYPFKNLDRKKNIVTINIYLNDNYEDGEICMYSSDKNLLYKYKPNAGDAVVMPSNSPFYHAVKNFYNNDRYFCRLFVSCELDNVDNNLNNDHIKLLENESDYIVNNLQTIEVYDNEIPVGDSNV